MTVPTSLRSLLESENTAPTPRQTLHACHRLFVPTSCRRYVFSLFESDKRRHWKQMISCLPTSTNCYWRSSHASLTLPFPQPRPLSSADLCQTSLSGALPVWSTMSAVWSSRVTGHTAPVRSPTVPLSSCRAVVPLLTTSQRYCSLFWLYLFGPPRDHSRTVVISDHQATTARSARCDRSVRCRHRAGDWSGQGLQKSTLTGVNKQTRMGIF